MKPSFAEATDGEGGAGGSTSPPDGGSMIPWAPVLQINAAIHLTVNGIFDFSFPYESNLSTDPKKQKPLPGRSGSVCLIVEHGGVEPPTS